MAIWESYESLPPLARIMIIFTVTALLIAAVYRINKWYKPRQGSNLEQKADGTLVAYIAFWRFAFFGLFFVAAFFICINALFRLYQELPSGFWKHWDENSRMVLIIIIIAVVMLVTPYSLLKSGYKKVQFELDNHRVRFLKRATRGGILLSDNYIYVPLKEIIAVQLENNLFGGGVMKARTATQSHTIILLLSTEEQLICLRALEHKIGVK